MKFIEEQVTFQELPGEVSLSYLISGCPIQCKDCHSKYSWDPNLGTELTLEYLQQKLDQYDGMITAVVFFGGEWHETELIKMLSLIKTRGLKTCLYTGQTTLNDDIIELLDYVKFGPYVKKYGGLQSRSTNQVFLEVKTNKNLTHLFWEDSKC